VGLKLAENLGRRTAALFTDAGHDVATVHGQEMQGATDRELFDTCRAEGRVLVTLDLDFTNPLRFPPAGSPGLAVLRVKETPPYSTCCRLPGRSSSSSARQTSAVASGSCIEGAFDSTNAAAAEVTRPSSRSTRAPRSLRLLSIL